ncbi:MFS transporter [Thalassospira alkalitolerans]|uniref:MFS transporter n=1 Tax=Thalassospira alkalitolerans TaxID=1293890 RepID=UPI003AA85F64
MHNADIPHHTPPEVTDPRQRRLILFAVCTALMAVIASVTGLNVAQPPLALDLNGTQSDVLWMINIYAISLSALLLPLGAAGDRWGRKPVLYIGLVTFAAANALAAIAMTTTQMLAARLLCGVGAAMIMPVTLSVITSVFPDEERSKAIGVWTAVAGGGGILGMFLSALLVDTIGWRWLFALPIVLAAISFVLAIRSMPNTKDHSSQRFDIIGAMISIISIIGMVTFLHEGPVRGWLDPVTLSGLVAGTLGSVGFIRWELRHPAPLLNVQLFSQRSLTSGSVTILVWFGVQAGVFIVLYPFFQAVLGWSGLLATVGLMPMAVLMMASSALAPMLSKRIGMRLTMATGMVLGATGLGLMATLVSIDGGYHSILPGMVVMGLGMGLSMTPSTEAITSSLPAQQQGVASALNDVTRELGTSLGVALLGAVFATGYALAVGARLDEVSPQAADALQQGIAAAQALTKSGAPDAQPIYRMAQEAFVQGWQQAMWTGVVTIVLLLVYVLLRGPENTKGTA